MCTPGGRQEVERLKGLVEERITCVESLITELSPALAVHTGPGTSGLCYFPWRAEAARMGDDAGLNGSAARDAVEERGGIPLRVVV